MRNRKFNIKPMLVLLLMLLSVLGIMQVTYSYFDKMSINYSGVIQIGSWSKEPPQPEDVMEYIEDAYPEMDDYLINLIGDVDQDGTFVIDPLYEEYSYEELKETVDLLKDFTDYFLTYDENGNAVFPEKTTVQPVELTNINSLLPGQHQKINQVIQTANNANTNYYSPITFQLTMIAPDGEDISDFAVEILFDSNPFAISSPFSYNYRLIDPISWNNNRASGSVSASSNHLVNISDSIDFSSKAYHLINNNWRPITYHHNYEKPTFSGSWCRLPVGPNYYLNKPESSTDGLRQQFVNEKKPKNREGLILMGKTDGTVSEMRIDIPIRNPRNGNSLPVIPIILVLSRGIAYDQNGNILPNQATTYITPIISIKVIEGQVWS